MIMIIPRDKMDIVAQGRNVLNLWNLLALTESWEPLTADLYYLLKLID